MGNPTAPKTKIILDKERNLLLDLNAMVAFEEETGSSLLSATSMSRMGMKEIRALLWACLIHEDESLTVKQVGAMVHAGNLDEITKSIEKAFAVAMPEPQREEKGGAGDPLT
ncbi:MAG: GTA-gp10 family protein [Bacillota bacterium]|jgi:hypothetical protein